MEEIRLSSESPSLVDYQRSSKRRRSDTSCSSGYQTSGNSSALGAERETTRLKRELAAARGQLSQMEESLREHVEIREKIIKVSENEKDILRSQLQDARKTIEELREEVRIARRAQTAAEAEFSDAKKKMEIQIAVLVENARVKDKTIYSSSERDDEIPRSIKTEEELILDEYEDSEGNLTSQTGSNAGNIDVNSSRSSTSGVDPAVPMHEERESSERSQKLVEERTEQLRSANDTLSSVGKRMKEAEERVSTTPKETNAVEKDCQRVVPFGRKISDFFSRSPRCQSRLDGILSPTLNQGNSRLQAETVVLSEKNLTRSFGLSRKTGESISAEAEVIEVDSTVPDSSNDQSSLAKAMFCGRSSSQAGNRKSSSRASSAGSLSDSDDPTYSPGRSGDSNNEDQDTDIQQQGDKFELVDIGKYYSYIVSKRFFDIDWDQEYTREHKKFVCKKCPRAFPSRTVIEDHVWDKHHNERYFCPHCPNYSGKVRSRSNLHIHVQMKHSELYHSEDFRKNIRLSL